MEKETKAKVIAIKYTCPDCNKWHAIEVKGEWFYKAEHHCSYDGYLMTATYIFEEKKDA